MYKIKLSQAAIADLNARRKKEKNKEIAYRLSSVYLAAKGKTNKEIVKILGVNKNSITNWIKIYLDKGIDELARAEDFDRRSAKIDSHIEAIKKDIKDNTISTLAELRDWIKKNYSLEIELSWLWRCCKKNSICLARKPA